MKLGIVGATGLVGSALVQEILTNVKCVSDLYLFGSIKKDCEWVEISGNRFIVHNIDSLLSYDLDIILFAAPAEVSKQWISPLLEKNSQVIVIDGSAAYRTNPEVPLIIPEINAELIRNHKRIITSPNCTTTLALMALAPLHKAFTLESFELFSYQAASGMGKAGLQELEQQCRCWVNKEQLPRSVFPRKLLFNAIPQIGIFDSLGNSEEEQKIVFESRKILNLSQLPIFATCVRIPALTCHSISITASFEAEFTLEDIKRTLKNAPGVKFYDNTYPDVYDALDNSLCHVGRLRINPIRKNTLSLWVVGNQILKGAATNMRQILEQLLII